MKKKLLSLLIVLVFAIGMLPGAVMATVAESVAFFNAESDRQIGTIENQSNVYAKVSFTAPKDGTASIIAAKYDSKGALISAEVVATPVMTKDTAVECTTTDINVSETDTLKIMGWDGFLSMTPVLKNPGILKGLDESSSFVKFEKAAEDLTYITNTDVEVGNIFKAAEPLLLDIDADAVEVTVLAVEGSTASGTYTKNAEDWTKGTVSFTGLGEVTISVTDNYYCTPTTVTATVKEPDPIDKFAAKENLTFEYTVQGEAIEKTLGDIFAVVENVTVKNESIEITVTDSEGVKTTLVENSEDWTQGTLSFSGAGVVVITITDNYFCNKATATVTITEPESADKFEAKDNLTFKHTIDDTVVTKSIGEIFTAIEGKDIDSVKVTVMTNSEKAVYTPDTADWTKGTLKFDGEGEYVVTISDNNYCNDAVAIVKIEEPDPIDKFVGKDGLSYELKDAEITVALGDIFTAKDNVTINNAGVTVDGATYAQNASDWTKGTLTFTAPGTYKITITDNKYCNNATATVTITEPVPVDKFDLVFEHTDKFLYRVGNQNTVALGSLFKAKDGAEIGNVSITVESNNSNATGTYAANAADWTKGTIQFAGTGPVKVTIVDDKYCNEFNLNLEVVDAKNATSAASAKDSNVVLLNDCGFGSLEINNGYTLYGNGFTMTCASDSPALYRRYAFVEMENGTIDNVQIECPNFSHAILYESNKTENGNPTDSTGDRYYNIRSAVMTDGVCNIYNSKISGGRAAVYQRSGTTTIDKSTIVGGAAANIQIETVKGLTLKDVSLIQKPIQATVNDTSKTLMGLSVVAFCDESGNVSPITLEGELHQYAWACSEYSKYVPSAGSSLVSTVLNQKDYIHAITYEDGVTRDSINLGFAFVQETLGKSVSSNIIDNRSNKDSVLYDTAKMSLAHIYSYKNTNGTDDSFKTIPEYESTGYNATLPEMEFAEQRDGLTFTNQYSADNQREATLNVDLDTLGAYNFSFNNLNVVKNGANLAYKVFDSNGNELNKDQAINLSSSDMRDYTLEITDNLFYDKDGNPVQGKEETYTYKFELVATMTSIDPPTKVAEPGGTPLLVVKSYDGDWSCAIPALEGTQIKYWSVTEKAYKTLALSSLTPTTTGKQNGTEAFWEKSTDDFTLKVTCGVIHDTKGVYGMPVVVNNDGNKMYFTISSTNGYVSTSTASRAVTITYEFTDKNGGTLKFSKSWSFKREDYTAHQYSYSDFVSGKLTELSSSSGGGGGFPCVTADTLITLADGTQKRIDEVQYSDELLVWDFYNGEYTIVPASYINNHGYGYNTIITLNFEDGTQVKVSNVHGFYDANLNEFVMIDDTNVENLVGHRFVQQDGNGYKAVKLTSYDIKEEYSESYSLLTYKYYNCIVEGLFSLTASEVAGNLFMPFEVGEDMTFDKAKMQSDIEKYGLYTYEEFADRLTLEEFEALNMPYIKIAVGKGIITYDEVLFLLDLHFAK